MFRGKEARLNLLQQLQLAEWTSEADRRTVVNEFTLLGNKLPIKALLQTLFDNLQNNSDPKSAERIRCIGEIINSAPRDISTTYLEDILQACLVDRQSTLMETLTDRYITSVCQPLVEVLRTGEDKLKKVAFQLLVTKGKANAYRELETSLRKDTWPTKRIGYFALKEIGGPRVVHNLMEYLKSPNQQDKLHAIELLSDMDNLQVINALVKTSQEARLPELKIKVAWALGQTNSARAIKPLAAMVDDDNWKTRVQAIRSLGKIKHEMVVKPLMDLLNHEDYRIRREAVNVISRSGDVAVLPMLVEKLKDVNSSIREGALEALGQLGLENRVDKYKIIIAILQHESEYIRNRLKDIMAIFKEPDLIERLVLSLENEDWWVRERVASTLLDLKEFNIVDPLTKLLDNENEIIRRFSVEVLEKLNDPRSTQALLRRLDDNDWWVKERTIEALSNIGDRRCLPKLIPLLKDPNFRYVITKALGKFREPQTIKHLIWVMKRGHKEVRIEAIKALESIGTPDVVEPITDMLSDENIAVRLEATSALKRMQAKLSSASAMRVGDIELADEKVVPLLDGLLLTAKKGGATDLYLLADSQPFMRRSGEVQVVYPMHLSPPETKKLMLDIMNDEQKRVFERELEIDFSYVIEEKGRFRVNCYMKKTGVSAVFRIIPDEVPTLDDLKMPEIIRTFGHFHQGLVLFAGAACQGKSTSMAALIDYINKKRKVNIISIEEPIEYIHENIMAQITQREVGVNTQSFASALRSALRQDPDIIAIGELRDLESISIAITAAETGHLVLGTLHAFSAPKTIDRIIGVFPLDQQGQIRLMLSENLKGVLCQQLVKTKDGNRQASFEILIGNTSTRTLIREKKTQQLPSTMVAASDEGMITMDHYLLRLLVNGYIEEDEALYRAHYRGDLEKLIEMEKETNKDFQRELLKSKYREQYQLDGKD